MREAIRWNRRCSFLGKAAHVNLSREIEEVDKPEMMAIAELKLDNATRDRAMETNREMSCTRALTFSPIRITDATQLEVKLKRSIIFRMFGAVE